MGNAELHRFLEIACGSVNELEYHLVLAKDLEYLSVPITTLFIKELLDLKRMLVALTRKVGLKRRE